MSTASKIKDIMINKKLPVNLLLKNLELIEYGKLGKYMRILNIKECNDYKISKELNTKLYVMALRNISVFRTQNIDLFKNFYKESRYIFKVYKMNDIYYIFGLCDINNIILQVLIKCFSDTKYTCLYDVYGPFIILNANYIEEEDKKELKYEYVEDIGHGEAIEDIEGRVKLYIKIANIYLKQTPKHYMNLIIF